MIKIYSILRKDSLVIAAAFFVLALLFWYKISPISFKSFDRICASNYGHASEYDKCMLPYSSQYGLNMAIFVISLGLSGISIIIFMIDKLSQKRKIY